MVALVIIQFLSVLNIDFILIHTQRSEILKELPRLLPPVPPLQGQIKIKISVYKKWQGCLTLYLFNDLSLSLINLNLELKIKPQIPINLKPSMFYSMWPGPMVLVMTYSFKGCKILMFAVSQIVFYQTYVETKLVYTNRILPEFRKTETSLALLKSVAQDHNPFLTSQPLGLFPPNIITW